MKCRICASFLQLITIYLSVLLAGCSRVKKQAISYANTDTLLKRQIMRLELDSVTSTSNSCIQYLYDDSSKSSKLMYFNEEIGSIYTDDLSTRKIARKWTPQITGKTLKKKFQGFYYYKKDSIFLFAFAPKVLLLNDSGRVLRTYNIDIPSGNKMQNMICRGMDVETKLMPYIYDNKMYLQSIVVGNLSKHEKRNTLIILDLRKGLVQLGAPTFPEEYKRDFGGLHYYLYSATVNPSTHQIIYSFPASGNLLVYSMESEKMTTYDCRSKYIQDIPEYEESSYKSAPSGATGEYFMENPSYGPILYDKYRNIYYRMAMLPTDKKNAIYEIKGAPAKNISVIILDSNFNYLGETPVEKNEYWPTCSFVSKEGLNLLNKSASDSTYDFSVFSVNKIK